MFILTVSEPFATKGIEYLLILGFLACLVLFWRLLTIPARVGAAPALEPGRAGAWFFPADRLYHRAHAWARQVAPGVVRIGLDDFAQQLLGRLDHVLLPGVHSQVAGDRMHLQVQTGGHDFHLPSPVSGEVVRINPAVQENSELVNLDPYGRGWLMEVKGTDDGPGRSALHPASQVRKWLHELETGLRQSLDPHLGQVLQDGGTLADGFARQLPDDQWQDLLRQHLQAEPVRASAEVRGHGTER